MVDRGAALFDAGLAAWMVGSAVLLTIMGLAELSRSVAWHVVPFPVEVATRVTVITAALTFALASGVRRRPTRSPVVLTIVMAMGSVTSLSLSCLHPGYATDGVLFAVLVMMVGLAMLVPVPLRFGLPLLAAMGSIPLFLLLGTGVADWRDMQFAVLVSDFAGGFAVSSMVAFLHTTLVRGRARALTQLARLAEHDALTGVYNRRAFVDRLVAESNRARRYARPVSVVLIDIDAFKRFNTDYGYATGDLVLRAVGNALDTCVRREEFRRFGSTVARYGGEEFVILVPEANEGDAEAVADACRRLIAATSVRSGDAELSVTASLGYAWTAGGAEARAGALIEAADRALYAAKAAGGNCVSVGELRSGPTEDPDPRLLAKRAPEAIDRGAIVAEARRIDMERIHGGVLRWMFGVGAIGCVLLSLLDVAVWIRTTGTPRFPIEDVLVSRFAIALILGWVAYRGERLPGWQRHLTTLHVAFSAVFGFGILTMTGITGGVESPYFAQFLFVISGWSLALSATQTVSLAMLSALTLCFPVFHVLVSGADPLGFTLMTRSAALLAASVAAIATQAVLTRLRAEEAEARGQLEHLARIDPLTGLPNRVAFERQLDGLLERAGPDFPLALLMLDLDHFKQLNDRHGHLAGDEALTAAAAAIEKTVRVADAAARVGGEEFMVVLPMTDSAGALRSAERLRAQIAATEVVGGAVSLTVSCGVACWRPGDRVTSLMERADTALRAAKRRGRDRVVLFDDDGNEEAAEDVRQVREGHAG